MRKIGWIFLIIWLGNVPLHAEGMLLRSFFSHGKQAAGASSRLQRMNISYQLEQRVARTYQKALQEQKAASLAYKTMPLGEPVNAIIHPAELDPHLLYPRQLFLTSAEQTGNYLAARNNVLVRHELRRTEQFLQELKNYLPALEQAAQQLVQPANADEFASWVVQQIPAQVQYVFIGEEHGYEKIRNLVTDLLLELRATQPNRPLFIFTEFLPEHISWPSQENLSQMPERICQYFPIWDKIATHHLSVIGLEPAYALTNQCQACRGHLPFYLQRQDVWDTLEGIRLRNQHWQTILATYRAQYPDALFIIYAGADHCLYNRPFALPNAYSKEDAFVVTLHPASKPKYLQKGFFHVPLKKHVPASGPLENLIRQPGKFPQPALKWDDAQLARISGFDIRLKVPVTEDIVP